ncbi:MAG TPA: TatD family hydrolase [Pirellulales bacterium]|nr:TatD family hydrolase [Pirellulales bacterium]
MIDSHAHLDDEQFDADRDEVVARSVAAGVDVVICIGTTAPTSAKCVEIAARYPSVYASVGIQPNYAAQAAPDDWDRVVALCLEKRVVALGETGLDRYWDYAPLDVQRDYFDRHLRLSQETGLPFVVHTRDCDADVLEMLREARTRSELRGVMHSFTGTAETAAECVAMGLYVSFAGMVTFKKSQALREVACQIPADRILIETDSPYLSPHPLRGKRNEPANLVRTATCLAEVRGVSLERFAAETDANTRQLFSGIT